MIHTSTSQKESPQTVGAGSEGSELTHSNITKNEATLLARFALLGHAVTRLRGGDYLVCRWGMSRYCHDLESLESFLEMLGGRRP